MRWGWVGSENCCKWTFVVVLVRTSPKAQAFGYLVSIGGAVSGGFEDEALLEEVWPWNWALRL